MNRYRIYVLFSLSMLQALVSFAQTTSGPVITVSGEVTKPLTLSVEDLSKMKRSSASLTDKDGKVHQYQGVAIQDILEGAGVTTGSQLRGEQLTKYLLVKCADGYEVLFSFGRTG